MGLRADNRGDCQRAIAPKIEPVKIKKITSNDAIFVLSPKFEYNYINFN